MVFRRKKRDSLVDENRVNNKENKNNRAVLPFQGGGSDVVSVSCFGVRVSVMFHFMCVHYTFSSVWVAEWAPFGK